MIRQSWTYIGAYITKQHNITVEFTFNFQAELFARCYLNDYIVCTNSNVALLLRIPIGQVRQIVSGSQTCGPTRDQQMEATWADLGYQLPARLIPEMHDKQATCTNTN